jgi:hypothetical protein
VVLPRHQPEAADRLCAALRRQAGITRVRLNRHAASVIVEFRGQAAQERLADTLSELPGFDLTLQGIDAAQDAAEKPVNDNTQSNKHRQASEDDAKDWHVMALEQVLQALRSEAEGLSPAEAAKRLDEEGRNLLTKLERRSDWHILREQFQSAPVAMLGVSAAIALMSAAPGQTGSA